MAEFDRKDRRDHRACADYSAAMCSTHDPSHERPPVFLR